MQLTTIVGPQASAGAGSTVQNARSGAAGELVVQELHGRYYETAVRRSLFSGANLAAVTTSAGFATTATGFCLTNPIGSTVNLVLNKVSYGTIVAQTTALILGIMTGYNTATAVTQSTPLVPLSNFVGSPAGAGLIASSYVMPTAPTRLFLLDTLTTGALTVSPQGGKIVDLEGGIVIPPGGYAAFYTSAASVATSLVFGMQWEEISIVV